MKIYRIKQPLGALQPTENLEPQARLLGLADRNVTLTAIRPEGTEKITGAEIVERAISIVKARIKKLPNHGIYHSVLRQLKYILNVLNGTVEDTSGLDKIIVGHYAVREFEESDPELADALIQCQNIAYRKGG